METRYKSTRGNGLEYLIRKALENKKHWVVEVYFNGWQAKLKEWEIE